MITVMFRQPDGVGVLLTQCDGIRINADGTVTVIFDPDGATQFDAAKIHPSRVDHFAQHISEQLYRSDIVELYDLPEWWASNLAEDEELF